MSHTHPPRTTLSAAQATTPGHFSDVCGRYACGGCGLRRVWHASRASAGGAGGAVDLSQRSCPLPVLGGGREADPYVHQPIFLLALPVS
jgi:hypothetical protein